MEDHQGLTEDAARRIREISISLNLTPDHMARRREYEACFRTGWTRFLKEDPLHANVIAWIVEDGLSNEDIAQLLGRTRGATREFISQCRKRARVYLAEWYALVRDTSDIA